MKLYQVILMVLMALVVNTACAELYKWTDKDGNTHFGDHIPYPYNGEQKKIDVPKSGLDISTTKLVGIWHGTDFRGQQYEWIIKNTGGITIYNQNPNSNEKILTSGNWKISLNKLAIDVTSAAHTNTQGVTINQQDLNDINVSILQLKTDNMTVLLNGDRIHLSKSN